MLRCRKYCRCVVLPVSESVSFALRHTQCVFYRVVVWHPVALYHGIAHAVSDAEPNRFADAIGFHDCDTFRNIIPYWHPEQFRDALTNCDAIIYVDAYAGHHALTIGLALSV